MRTNRKIVWTACTLTPSERETEKKYTRNQNSNEDGPISDGKHETKESEMKTTIV